MCGEHGWEQSAGAGKPRPTHQSTRAQLAASVMQAWSHLVSSAVDLDASPLVLPCCYHGSHQGLHCYPILCAYGCPQRVLPVCLDLKQVQDNISTDSEGSGSCRALMLAMFRNKVLVRAGPSSSSTPPPPFLLRQVSFSTDAPSVDIEILCCRLSRRHRLACLPQPPADALLVYQRCQSAAAAEAASEIAAAFLDASVGEEEEVVCSGALVAKAVECGLRCLMLERGWRFVGGSIFVDSTFAASEERTDLRALNVEVRSGLNDDYEFVVSPDAFRFTALKISDVASSSVMETFQRTEEVSLDGCSPLTACAILPTLQEGHVIGFSKLLPSGQSLDNFTELCSVKHGLEMNYSYHAAVKLTCGVSWEKQWLPSPLVLQGSGLQPALKSVRASKAMSSLQFFVELLTAWNFFGQNQFVVKEQLLVSCTTILPTWDKAISKLSVQTARTDNSEDLGLVHTSFMAKDQSLNLDFRTPKPAVFCSSSAKVHELPRCMDDDGTSNGTRSTNHFFPSQPIVLTSSSKSQVTLLKPSFSRSKRANENKTRCSSEQSYADSSNKTGLPKPSHRSSPKVSVHPKRKRAEFLENSDKGETAKVHQKDCCERRNLDTIKSKDYTTDVPHDTKLMLDIKDVLSAKTIETKSKTMVGKDEINFMTKSKRKPAVVKEELTKKVIDHQKDVTQKVAKAKTVLAKDELTLTAKTKTKPDVNKNESAEKAIDHQKDVTQKVAKAKTKPDVNKNESAEKVIDHHKRGEMRLLTVAELKCFLSIKKAKVGGTKEVLIQRANELLS
ncbi:uncharacterized protein [Lolium perenne]|uniref:uncharacterized protein isoform X3 n=1 Tax=Lolium perenne TaxID=4522 RepID=UPI0021F5986A|nr:uncharacterized protein LOC127304025 isoform X3 [Lolium perenne]